MVNLLNPVNELQGHELVTNMVIETIINSA